GGLAASPALFISQGTRTGAVVGAVDTPTYNEAITLPRVDAVSTATYGDSVHFVPEGNLILDASNRMEKTDPYAGILGIKKVDVRVDFDLYANAALLDAAGAPTAQSAAVLGKFTQAGYGFTALQKDSDYIGTGGAPLASLDVYAVKPLLVDGSFGGRAIIDASAARALPGLGNGGSSEGVTYGGNWGDKMTGFSFGSAADLGAEFAGASYWDNFAEYIYGGTITDESGHMEPLVFLQNLFTHRMHEDFDVAISPSRFPRLASLDPAGTYSVRVFAEGFEDITFDFEVKDFINQNAAVNGSTTVSVDPAQQGSTDVLIQLTGISDEAAYAAGATLRKGAVNVAAADYEFVAGTTGSGEVTLRIHPSRFADTLWPGAYSAVYETTGAVSKSVAFTLKTEVAVALLARKGEPTTGFQPGQGASTPYRTYASGSLYIGNAGFAQTLVIGGRSGFSTLSQDGAAATAIALGGVLKQEADGSRYIDLAKLTPGSIYALTLAAPGYNNQVYHIKVDVPYIPPLDGGGGTQTTTPPAQQQPPGGTTDKPGTPDSGALSVTAPGKAGSVKLVVGKANTRKVTVSWKASASATKQQIRFRVKGTAAWKTVTVPANATKRILTKLKKGKIYQVQVRGIRTEGGKNYYGAWSAVKSIRVK
ncbi:MAG: fibronectin type III domain-containing protein, partial [Clostridiales Family XIII bacterium]|nr:fibronectin type III domain-containing protein [Clostridiales Family XIII bacterium]